MKFLLSILLFLQACSVYAPQPVSIEGNSKEKVEQLYANYLQYSASKQDSDGFILTQECDALLFSSLHAIASGREFNIRAARDANTGQWYRRPQASTGGTYDACYPKSANSTISRDMLLGVILYGYYAKDLDLLINLYEYGNNNNWTMGQNDSGDFRHIFSPSTIGLLAKSIRSLGGPDYGTAAFPQFYSTEPGYQSHLSLLSILLVGKTEGRVSDIEKNALASIVSKNPNNPLAHALYGRYVKTEHTSIAVDLLLSQYPNNRLPNGMDWCEEWRTQREETSAGLQPCKADSPHYGIEHTGGDALFVAAILLNRL